MVTVWKLKGRITEDGKLDIVLPDDLPSGEVDIELQVHESVDTDETLFTQEELDELLTYKPFASGEEFIAHLKTLDLSAFAHITDSVEWVRQQREEQRRRRNSAW